MKKFCVFCGNEPQNQNLEHIIPKWLIELTGELNRKANFGYNRKTNQSRVFSFKRFWFPSCKSCNDRFSDLEGKTKPIVIKLLENQSITYFESKIILDWMDKIRVGMWLSFQCLDGKAEDFPRHYHINDRLGMLDRCLFVYKSDYPLKGVRFMDGSLPFFQFAPCCYFIAINDMYLVSVSSASLISEKLGLPFAKQKHFTLNSDKTTDLSISFEIGNGVREYPLLTFSEIGPHLEVFQPLMESKDAIDGQNTIDLNFSEFGKIFTARDNQIIEVQECDNIEFSKTSPHSFDILEKRIMFQTINLYESNLLSTEGHDYTKFSSKQRKKVKSDRKYFMDYLSSFRKKIRKEIQQLIVVNFD